MSDADETKRCARCGAEFTPSSSPLGVCPSCLLKLGMSDPAMTPPSAEEAEPETVAADPKGPALHDPAEGPKGPALHDPAAGPKGPALRLLLVILIAALLAIAAGAMVFRSVQPPGHVSEAAHAQAVRFTLTLPDGMQLPEAAQFAVSEDGTQVVVAARGHENRMPSLWLRRLQSLEWRELPRTDGAAFPFWSPDGRHIGFFAGSRLKRIDIGNDLTETICDVVNGRGGAWGTQGVILFAGSGGLFRVSASGGTSTPVRPLAAERGETAHLRPQFLPDERHFLFTASAAKDRKLTTYIGDPETGEIRAITNGGAASFVDGQLLFSRGASLAAQPFDVESGDLSDEARTIGGIEDVTSDVTNGSAFAASSTVLVYQRHEPRQRRLMWFDRNGRVTGAEDDVADADGIAVSADRRTLAVVRRDGDSDTSSIWLKDVDSPRVSRLTWGHTRDESPVWSPDSSRIAFSSRRDDNQRVHIVVRDLNGKEESLLQLPDAQLTDWSRDGRFLIYSAPSPKTRSDLWMLPTTGDKKPLPLDQSPANESQGVTSPDGRWLAYVSDQSGADEIYLRPFPPMEGRWQVSTGGGTRPRWSDDGREILFLSPDSEVMAVQVQAAPSLPPRLSVARRLFVLNGVDDFALRGQRLIAQLPVEHGSNRQLEVILNWAAELQQ
jgi:Tol biopolymer transport system component